MPYKPSDIDCLFVDIGGVLLSDGWGNEFRLEAATKFEIDFEELETRHRQAFEAYEMDRLNLRQYLALVVFHRKRNFSEGDFRDFMFSLSTPHPQMIELVKDLKSSYGLKIIAVSNEGRETNAHRIGRFAMHDFVDTFLSSAFLHLRKPDPEFYRLALDVVQTPPDRILYVENTPMFVEVARSFGIHSILHRDVPSTRESLLSFGLDPRLLALA